MRICRLIAPIWLLEKHPDKRRVLEGIFTDKQLKEYNKEGYNVFYLPNHPSTYQQGTVDGSQIDTFQWCFIDYDAKDGVYPSTDEFIEAILTSGIQPTKLVDSGHGCHAYFRVSDLDAMSYLRLQRRLMRLFNTDEATCSIYQLMRLEGTTNTKYEGKPAPCVLLDENMFQEYTCEELNALLPPITQADETFCQQHYAKTYNPNRDQTQVSEVMPAKWGELLLSNAEVKAIWTETSDDRSKSDYRLGHLMFGNGFNRDEAITVLANSAKALSRQPIHRISYAENIVDKIWTFETKAPDEEVEELSMSVSDILKRDGDTLKGTRFPCHPRIDNTEHGFRLGQVIGLVAGSGVGKTAFSLNLFKWFAERNPDYHHFFIPLEQPANEIADRWKTMCGVNTSLHEKVHILSNYDSKGNFRHLSFDQIREYIEKWQIKTGFKAGCVVIDHIGALKKKGKSGENQDLMDICHAMKAFAVQTNTLLVMQSQTSREKAGIGDLELNKDAAYGTMFFEAYTDYLITIHQPLKRCHMEPGCPTVTAYKFCKIRHKKANKDLIHEDVCYYLNFDPTTEMMTDMTQMQVESFSYFNMKATNLRKQDRKTDVVSYTKVNWQGEDNGPVIHNKH